MEIFGIPVLFIIFIAYLAWANYTEQEKKKKEESTKKWGAIHIGMVKDEVIRSLGKPHREWQAGEAEILGFGPSDSDGQITFLSGKVIAYQKPD